MMPVSANEALAYQTPAKDFAVAMLLCMSVVFLCAPTLAAGSSAASAKVTIDSRNVEPLQTTHKVIQLTADHIPNLLGWPIEQYSVASVKSGLLRPIPFQIDEYNQEGSVYFAESDIPIDGVEKLLDGNDRVLFMLQDAGPKRDPNKTTDGEVKAEIEILMLNGESRYVYLLKGARLKSDDLYVRYRSDLARVETDFYNLTMSQENALNWDDFNYYGYRGESSPIDTMKLRLNVGVITPITKATLSNEHIVATPIAEKVGPIRAVTQFDVKLWLLGMPMLKMRLQVCYYPNALSYETRFTIPPVRRALIQNPNLVVSVDGNQMDGAQYRSALIEELALVDGELSDLEKQMIENGIDEDNAWIWLSTGKAFDIFSSFEFLEQSVPLNLSIVDDAKAADKPERFTGQSPNLGYRLETFPRSGNFGMMVNLYFSNNFAAQPTAIAEALNYKPPMQIHLIQEQYSKGLLFD